MADRSDRSAIDELYDHTVGRMTGEPNAGTSLMDVLAIGTLCVLVAMLLVVLGVVDTVRQVLAASLLVASGLSLVLAYNRSRSSGFRGVRE